MKRIFLGLLVLLVGRLSATPVFERAWQDGMVVQRGQPIALRGTAAPGEAVTLSFGGKAVAVKAGPDGGWNAQLPAFAAAGVMVPSVHVAPSFDQA